MPPMEKKNAKSRRETAVQGTNDSSILSKCSTSSCGYYQDPYLPFFVSKQSRRAPLIHRGYYIRAKAFETVLQSFLKHNAECRNQIISLGCGFDSAYFRLKDLQLLTNTKYFEIDFPDLVRRKRMLIENTDILMKFMQKNETQPLSPHIELSCKDYHLLGVDLTQLNTLEAALKMCGIDFEAPTLLFSECVMTYMTKRCSTDLVKWAAETFENAFFGMYEQVNPDDAFGLFMQNHFHTIGSPLKCINAYPTLDSQKERFFQAGWQSCDIVDMNTFFYQCLPESEQRRVDRLEVFDEYEEMNLKYSHYFILTASTFSSSANLIAEKNCPEYYVPVPVISNVVTIERLPDKESIRRFGHSSCVVGIDFVITTGGFGETDGRHQRLAEITVTSVQSLVSYHIPCTATDDIEYARMHHASVALSNGTIYVIAGRQSPYCLCSQLLKVVPHFNSCMQTDLKETPALVENGFTENHFLSSHIDMKDMVDSCQNENTSERNLGEMQTVSKACPELGNLGDFASASNNECVQSENLTDCVHDGLINLDETESVPSNEASVKKWTCPFGHINFEVVNQTGSPPCNRSRHAVTKIYFGGRERIFLHGGKDKNGQALGDAFMYDPSNNEWTSLTTQGEVPDARHSHSVLFWNGQVVLSGGLHGRQIPADDIYLLDLLTLVWTRLNISGHLSARYSHCSEVISDRLVLIGGVNLCHPPPGVAVINLRTKRALEFALPVQDKSSLLMFHRHTSVLLDSKRILLLGGGGNCFSFGTHLNRTPVILNLGTALDDVN